MTSGLALMKRLADEGRIDRTVERLVFSSVATDQRGHQVRTESVALFDGVRDIVDDEQRHFWDRVPLPLVRQSRIIGTEVVHDRFHAAFGRGNGEGFIG